jgi:hypothetical protein
MKTTYVLFAIIFIFSGMQFTSCSGKAEPARKEEVKDEKRLFARFYARHLAEDGKTMAEVSLMEGNNKKQAQQTHLSGGIFYAGGAMEEQNLSSVNKLRYKSERQEAFEGSFDFVFAYPEGEEQSFSMPLAEITDFSLSNPLRKSKGALLKWSGSPLDQDETLVLLISDSEQKAATLEIKGPSSENSIEVRPEKLEGIAAGEARFYLVRKKTYQQKAGKWEGSGTAEYYTKSRVIQVQP